MWGRRRSYVLAVAFVITSATSAIGVGQAAGAPEARAQAGGPEVTASPSTGLLPGDAVTVTGTGFVPGLYLQLWCTPDLDPSDPATMDPACRTAQQTTQITVGADGTFTTDFTVVRATGDWFEEFVCGDGAETCSVAVGTGEPGQAGATVVAAVPLGLVPETLTVTPSSGVLDGQMITVEGAGLPPNSSSMVLRCPNGTSGYSYELLEKCDLLHGGAWRSLDADSAGRGTLTLRTQVLVGYGTQFGQTVCTDQCHVRVMVGGASRFREAPFTYAEAELAATPDEGLADGQAVQVDATGLALSYAGARVWIFPSGGWSLAQCDASVLVGSGGSGPGLGDLFDLCAAAPTTRGVTVDANELHEPIEVRSQFTSFLGREVDCGSSPGACVVGLARLEENGAITTHLTPVTFGS
jgi:hypothetical protein